MNVFMLFSSIFISVASSAIIATEEPVFEPTIFYNSTSSVTATAGESVKLECHATGNPIPEIKWRRENNALLPTGGSVYRGNVLDIVSVTKEDRGNYYCIATNGIGVGTRRIVRLEVEFSPIILVSHKRVGQALSHDTDLLCQVEAYPEPAITWIKDGVQLTSDKSHKISIFSISDGFTDSNLRIIKTKKDQYGIYTCKAANKLGSSESNIEFFETESPICPPACSEENSSN